jgi:hypothetical protein
MTTDNEERDVTQHCFDPFPEPQTIPTGWDLSALLSTTEADTVQQADASFEDNSVVE